jgi:hypothetical protein
MRGIGGNHAWIDLEIGTVELGEITPTAERVENDLAPESSWTNREGREMERRSRRSDMVVPARSRLDLPLGMATRK